WVERVMEEPVGRASAGAGPNPPLWCPAAAVTSPVNSLNSLAWTSRDPSTSRMRYHHTSQEARCRQPKQLTRKGRGREHDGTVTEKA
ncbi:hypothetical protein SK128_028359, partial [Halocaridina rubra]